jgi:hypothetical protein
MQRAISKLLFLLVVAFSSLILLWFTLNQAVINTAINAERPVATIHSIPSPYVSVQTGSSPADALSTTGTLAASIITTKTVGTTPSSCATADEITVGAGTEVIYCYYVRNTGSVTLTHHTVVDDQIGTLQDNSPITLTPANGLDPAAFFTAAVRLNATTINTVIWTATGPAGARAVATDTTTVLVPTVAVTHTVGTDPQRCATGRTLNVAYGASVVHCYTVHNTGPVSLPLHSVTNSQLGPIFTDRAVPLLPGDRLVVTATATATKSTTSVVTWTAKLNNGVYALATDRAQINTPAIVAYTTVGTNPSSCATTSAITVTYGTPITFCYQIANTGGIPFERYDVFDTAYGRSYLGLTKNLPVQANLWFTVTTPVTRTTVNTVTWLAYTAGGLTATSKAAGQVGIDSVIEVLVFYDVNDSGFLEDAEPGIEGITVTLELPTKQSLLKRTDAQGFAIFPDLRPGLHTISMTTNGLRNGFTLRSGDTSARILNVGAAGVYSTAFTLVTPPGTDSDNDFMPDRLEGAGDTNGNGIPNYLDPNDLIFMPMVRR